MYIGGESEGDKGTVEKLPNAVNAVDAEVDPAVALGREGTALLWEGEKSKGKLSTGRTEGHGYH